MMPRQTKAEKEAAEAAAAQAVADKEAKEAEEAQAVADKEAKEAEEAEAEAAATREIVTVKKGASVTTKAGIKVHGDEITEKLITGGDTVIQNLLKSKLFVKIKV